MSLFADDAIGIADPYLRRAFALAERGRGTTSPNPLVGCVLVRDEVVVGEGFHERAGGPHAEVVALAMAGDSARGARAYVTLEPCTHFGKTPPCAPALMAAGVVAAVIGMPDPNSAVSGGGAIALEAAGVAVTWSEDRAAFERQNEAWRKRLATGLPFVRAKVALTLDGRPALEVGRRARISGAGGAEVTRRLRDAATAIAVGASTVAIDDPRLTARDASDVPVPRQPRRYVLARTGIPAPEARVFEAAGATVITGDEAALWGSGMPEGATARAIAYRASEGLSGALRAVADDGCDDVLIETGPRLFSALWDEGLIDELVVVTAGGVGGASAPALYAGGTETGARDLSARMHCVEAGVIGDDAVTVWRPFAEVADGIRKGSA